MTDTRKNGGPVVSGLYQHRNGGIYEVVGVGKMQAANWHEQADELARYPVDMAEVVIYRPISYSTDECQLWVRPVEEFLDGRFTALTARSPSSKEA